MKHKKTWSWKIFALVLTVCALIGGIIVTVIQTGLSVDRGHPFLYVFTNGKNKNVNSDYRLLGRSQKGYPNANRDDKLGDWSRWEQELGLVLDNSNPAVQAEQLNWLYYLLFFKNTRKNKEGNLFVADSKAKDPDKYAMTNSGNSTFDGIRIDCGDGIDSDVLGQTAQLLDDLYDRTDNDANSNDHLSFAEGYGPTDQINQRKYFRNTSLNYDDGYYHGMRDNLMWYKDTKAPKLYKAKGLISTDWSNDQYEDSDVNPISPNLTYSQNHDNFNARVWDIALSMDPSFSYKGFNDKKQNTIVKASEEYYKKLGDADKTFNGKQAAPKNLVSLYADMLVNKDTVPVVFYGDIFEGQKDYMKTPTVAAEPIMDILEARSKYVSGGQQRKTADKNGHIITNVRFGKNYYEGRTKQGSDDFKNSRNSGIVTVYSNDQNLKPTDLKVYVGLNHKGQQYTNLIDTTSDKKLSNGFGLTLGKSADKSNLIMGVKGNPKYLLSEKDEDLTVDDKGYLTIPEVKGVNSGLVDGYLSVWVPNGVDDKQNVYVTEKQAKDMHSHKNSGYVLNSNSALDSHVVYQDFSVNMPDQGHGYHDQDDNGDQAIDTSYKEITHHAQDIANSGITDVWMAPPYISPDLSKPGTLKDWVSRYGYGYMMKDRYNLGEGDTPSKYGTADDLVKATDALHDTKSAIDGRSIKVINDFVPHQIIRGDSTKKEKVTFDVYDAKGFGYPLRLGATHVVKELQTRTSDENWQHRFGGLYLETMKRFFNDVFDTPALSTGEIIPSNERIRNWSAKYETAYPLEFEPAEYDASAVAGAVGFNVVGYYTSKRNQ